MKEEHFFCFILLTQEGSHREVYQEFQPSYVVTRVVQTTDSVHIQPTLHEHRANNQYRRANQV